MSQPSNPALDVRVAMDTDTGQKRKQNQDAIGHSIPTNPDHLARLGRIFVLADGVGGLAGGDLASQYAVSTIISSYYAQTSGDPADRLARAIGEANNVIFAEWQDQDPPQIMATTVVAAVVCGEDLVVGSVGDSPAYLMREGHPRQLTRDHTLENQRLEEGKPLQEGDPAGRKLVRALGSQAAIKVDIITGKVRGGDHVVLCSDGLTRYVPPAEIEHMVATLPPDDAVRDLIALANERGGADNISVIVLSLHDDDLTARVGTISDPMESWGVPRRIERAVAAEPAATRSDRQARRRQRTRTAVRGLKDTPVGSLLVAAWDVLRGNVVMTAVGMAATLIVFVIIMLLVTNAGNDSPSSTLLATRTPTTDFTETAGAFRAATAQAIQLQTSTARAVDGQAGTVAALAIASLTPPSQVPTYGPQMDEAMWFRVLGSEPVPAYQEPDTAAQPATPLQPEGNYRVTMVNRAPAHGPWYQVIDNLGQEARWVNGPDLHARVVAVDLNGRVLPDDQQPVDIAPPYEDRPTATPTATPTPLPTLTGTPGTPATAAPTLTPSLTPTVAYGPDSFPLNSEVVALADLDLCSVPSVRACDAGSVFSGEVGVVQAGPVASGEHWWWQVDFGGSRSGWVAQVLIGTR